MKVFKYDTRNQGKLGIKIMRIHWIIIAIIIAAGCSGQGAPIKKDAKKITLNTGIKFAHELVEKRYTDAHSMLTADLQRHWPAEKLKTQYEEMIPSGCDPVTAGDFTEFMDDWPGRRSSDFGWVYVSISGSGFTEAVTVIITDEDGTPKIRELEWGRP